MRITSSPVAVQQTKFHQANATVPAREPIKQLSQNFPQSAIDRRFMRQAGWSLLTTRLKLSFHSVRDLEQQSLRVVRTQMSGASLNRLLLAIEHSAGYIPNATSLVRTLAAQRLLAHHGYRTELHLGLQKHAWLTYRGHVIVGSVFFPGDEEKANTFLA